MASFFRNGCAGETERGQLEKNMTAEMFLHLSEKEQDDLLDEPLINIKMTTRSYNSLNRYGFKTVRDVRNILLENPKELLKIRYLGKKSLNEIISTFGKYGIDTEDVRQRAFSLDLDRSNRRIIHFK